MAAIDIGTNYSGYAFSLRVEFERDPLRVSTFTWTAQNSTRITLKIPTTLLLKENGDFHSFGYDAEVAYEALKLDGEHEKYYYFHRFKMAVFDGGEVY